MYLTKWEEKALQGEFGEAVQLAMNVLVKVCKALKAEKLVEIAHAHVSGVSYFNIGDEGLQFLEDLVKRNAKVSVYTTANPSSIAIVSLFSSKYDPAVVVKQEKLVSFLKAMGIDGESFTCIPYKLRMPRFGEHLAWAESSAVVYANSIVGARTNREGGVTALMAAIAGRTCYCGMHIDEERRPTELIKVEFPIDSIALASALGLYIGKITKGIPYIEVNIRVDHSLKEVAIRSMLASIASTSSSPMVFIDKVSPEAGAVDKSSLEKIAVDVKEVKDYIEDSCTDTLIIGCPHVDVEEAKEVLSKALPNVKDYGIKKIYIALPLFNAKQLKDTRVYLDNVEIIYLPGVCPIVSNLKTVGVSSLCTPHGKASYYLPRLSGVKTCLTNIV